MIRNWLLVVATSPALVLWGLDPAVVTPATIGVATIYILLHGAINDYFKLS